MLAIELLSLLVPGAKKPTKSWRAAKQNNHYYILMQKLYIVIH